MAIIRPLRSARNEWYGEAIEGSRMLYITTEGEICRYQREKNSLFTFPNEKILRIIAKWKGHECFPRKTEGEEI